MARQHGYFILIPAFIPVDKKSLQNQIRTGTVIHEAAQTQDLAAIMALPGIRYHASKTRGGAPKELHSRWGSVEVESAQGTPSEGGRQDYPPVGGQSSDGGDTTTSDEPEPEADPAATTGRRKSAKAA